MGIIDDFYEKKSPDIIRKIPKILFISVTTKIPQNKQISIICKMEKLNYVSYLTFKP